MWDYQMWEKNNGTTKCDKSTIRCDAGTAPCDDGTIKCKKKKIRVLSNVTKIQ